MIYRFSQDNSGRFENRFAARPILVKFKFIYSRGDARARVGIRGGSMH